MADRDTSSARQLLWDTAHPLESANRIVTEAVNTNRLAELRELCQLILSSLQPDDAPDESSSALRQKVEHLRDDQDDAAAKQRRQNSRAPKQPQTGRHGWHQKRGPR